MTAEDYKKRHINELLFTVSHHKDGDYSKTLYFHVYNDKIVAEECQKFTFITPKTFIKYTDKKIFDSVQIEIQNTDWNFTIHLPLKLKLFEYLYKNKDSIKKHNKTLENHITQKLNTLKIFKIQDLKFIHDTNDIYIIFDLKNMITLGITTIEKNKLAQVPTLKNIIENNMTVHESISWLKEINDPSLTQWNDIEENLTTFAQDLKDLMLESALYTKQENNHWW